MHDDPSNIIRARRMALGLTQEETAHRAGMSISGWRLIETGKIQNPTLDTARAIARVLECELVTIWTWARDDAGHTRGSAQ